MGQGDSTRRRHAVEAPPLTELFTASALILLTLPLMILVAVAIKCESQGPIFSRTELISPRGRRFSALKFRSTVCEPSPARGLVIRVTFVGSIIRFLRIENLPQLLNVLRGEMSCFTWHLDQSFFLD